MFKAFNVTETQIEVQRFFHNEYLMNKIVVELRINVWLNYLSSLLFSHEGQ